MTDPSPEEGSDSTPSPAAGWYPDPNGYGRRWWDGHTWGPVAPPQPPMVPPPVHVPPQEKSSAIALLLTILFPGAGHLYLGFTQKSIPHMVANAIGVFLALTVILLPITFLIWLATLVMTVGSLTRDTETANEAIRAGRPIKG